MNNHEIYNICALSNKIKEFYNPFLNDLGINYTHQTRVFNNGKSFLLTNNPKYLQHFIDKKYALPGVGIYTKPGMHLWSGITGLQNYDSQVIDMRKNFNIAHQIAMVYVEEEFVDIFALASTPNKPEMVNYFINNKDRFDNLFANYKDTFKRELEFLGKKPLSIPLRPKNFISKRRLLNEFHNISLRELDCMQQLKLGLTAKMIAKQLVISHRTVERHIDNIREKLQVKSKLEIVQKYNEYLAEFPDSHCPP